LQDRKGGIVGYSVLDTMSRQIHDLAILEKYRTADNSSRLIREVINEVKRVGGIWQADARESTSFRMLNTLRNLGYIEFVKEPEQVRTYGNTGEPLYNVQFKAKEEPKKAIEKKSKKQSEANKAGIGKEPA
jgi:hypothetical protein